MRKVMVVFGSFVAGISITLLFLVFSGSQTSALAQGQSKGIVNEGLEPIVPPLHHNVFKGAHMTNVEQPLDGFECEDCSFTDVTLTYAGGAVRIVNPKFSGTTRLVLKGAAANTSVTVSFLQAMLQNQKPPTFSPNAPILKRATVKDVFSADLVTPYGQK
jgi:hypothetical protein